MSIEQYTEALVLREMQCSIGENPFGYVFPQGDVEQSPKLERLLKKAGGKPAVCALTDYTQGGNGKAKPEYVITFSKAQQTIIVVECKKTTAKHVTEKLDCPKDYAVDGALYYAKFLKEEYNVIALGVSGTKKDSFKVNAYYWQKGQDSYIELKKARDIIYEPENYLRIVSGEAVKKAVSIETIQELALEMHESLRALAVTERAKPVFIAGILIALKDKDFITEYPNLVSFNSLLKRLQDAIDNVLADSDVRKEKIADIKSHFQLIGRNTKIKVIPLGHYNSLSWYIEELERKIKPMMDYADNTIDALGIFYHEFVKYSGGDGSGLGIVLTPQHLTDFMCELAAVNKNSRVVDICCGSGTFLVTAMSKMFRGANDREIKQIRDNALFGVESDDDIYTLAIANMIVRGDGKSNIIFGDCFNAEIKAELKTKNINIGLINPPYSQDITELEFVENLLDILTTGGAGVVVVPMSCAIGTKFKDTRERLLKKHTLKAVFSMPDDIFYSNNASTNVCVMVWEAHKPHDSAQNTFFGYYKDDGFVKAKKLGRIDKFNKWEAIEAEWLRLYRDLETREGMSVKKPVKWNDEWLCEAYMETDYSVLRDDNFIETLRNYAAYNLLTNTDMGKVFDCNPISGEKKHLHIENWEWFSYKDLFQIKGSKTTPLVELKGYGAGDYPYITTQAVKNGVAGFFDLFTEEGGVFTVDSAVVGFCAYQEKNFSASDHVEKLLPLFPCNIYIALFMTTIINMEQYRFSYGRKRSQKKLRVSRMKLPVDANGNPDWEFIENYVKGLPYSRCV